LCCSPPRTRSAAACFADHLPASAAPLFLIAAVSIGRPPQGRQALLRLVAVLAFTAWGTAQLMPGQAAGPLHDAAIVLFVIDGGYLVVSEARAILTRHPLREHNLAVSC